MSRAIAFLALGSLLLIVRDGVPAPSVRIPTVRKAEGAVLTPFFDEISPFSTHA